MKKVLKAFSAESWSGAHLGAAVLGILLLGGLFTGWALHRENRSVLEDLLQQARLVAQAIPLDRVDLLEGAPADEDKPEYRLLREQLQAVVRFNSDWECLYLMGITNGTVFFQIDAGTPGYANPATPGQLYEEASERLRNVFKTRLPTTEGPVRDRWGVWVSAFVPLSNPRTGQLATVVGLDIKESTWRMRMANAAVVPLLCTAMLLALATATYRLRNWRQSATSGRRPRWRTPETAAVVALGLILTGAAAWATHTAERRNQQDTFAAIARIETERILESFLTLRNAELEGVAHFIEGSREVTREEFRTYVRYLVRIPKVMAWGWVPAVRSQDRDVFEEECREAGFRSYQIWEVEAEGKRIRAEGRGTYYPLHYVESLAPLAKYGLACGRDLGAETAIRPTLDLAAETRLTTATDLLAPLAGSSSDRQTIAVFRPVFGTADKTTLRGFALALVNPQRLLDTFWGEQLEGNRQIVMDLLQLRLDGPPEPLASLPRNPAARAPQGVWVESRPILAFGDAYAAVARPTAEFIAGHSYHFAWLVLLAGLVFTAAGTLAIAIIAHRREDLEGLVEERTRDLASSMRRYDLLARQSHTITWETDAEGLYTQVSAVAKTVLGYAPEELVGKMHFYDLLPAAEREAYKAAAFEVFARRESFLDFVNPVLAKSGEIVWVSTDGMPILDAQGQLRGYQGSDKDITARKRAEDALALLAQEKQEAAKRYQALIRASDTGAWEYRHNTGHMWTSAEYFAMLGRNPADYVFPEEQSNVRETWLDLIHPDDRAQAHQDFIDYMERPEGLYQHTFRMSHADGRWLWILSRGQLLRDANGRPTPVLLGTHIDITERKQAEQYRELDATTLQILHRPGEFNQRLDELAALFKDEAGFDAISIRLRDGINFPFVAHRGLTPEHLAHCREVIELDPQGVPRKDAAGNVVLRCTCGLALAERAERRHHWFSPGGSCWTNDLEQMLRAGPGPRTDSRDHCFQAGYASVAWIPIRQQGEIIGLLQLHDRRKGRFSPETVQILESIAAHVGEAWQRRRAEQDYRTLFQTMLEGFALHEIICDDQGRPSDYRFLALNPAFERMTGLKAADLVGKTAREALPNLPRRWIEIYGNVALTGTALSFENHSAAQGRYFEVTAFQPAPHQFACLFTDITDRKASENRLRENRRRYVALLANLPGMAYRCRNDRKWTMEFVSQGCQELTGYAAEELVDNRVAAYSDIIALPYREYVWQEWQKALAERRPFEGEYQIVTRTGETKWVWERGDAVHNSQGQFVGLEGFIADVTDRKRSEAEREQLIRAIEQSTETIVITDAKGAMIYVNPAFTRTTGYTREEALGQNPSLLKSGSHDATFYRDMWTTLESGAVWEGQVINRRKDGTLFTEQATISPVRDFAGRIVNFVAVKRDITQQLHDQRERENLQTELVQAQKMESIGRLAGGVAHDFNNMLQAILGYTEMALEQVPADQPLHADLLEIQKAAQRSSALTRQLQVFARKQTMAPKVLDLNQAVDGMLAMLRRLIGEDIHLEWKPGTELGSVKIDPSQLDQIVANLSVNARDAIDKTGHVIIETQNAKIDRFGAELHGGIQPGDYVLLAVSDDGCGMGPDVLGHLFEPFFTTKPLGKGTGLGLSTVYGIVKQNGGGIQVYSEPGQGTTFKIYLPRHQETADAAPPDEKQDPASPNHETILLVEDEESILQTSRRMLESLGYRVLATNSPDTAIRMAEGSGDNHVLFQEYADQIDLLITDVIMPEMNGPDLVARLKGRFPHLKHLFMSGYTANLIAVQGVQAGKTDFIQKPFSRTALAQKVREVLDRK